MNLQFRWVTKLEHIYTMRWALVYSPVSGTATTKTLYGPVFELLRV